MPSHLTHVAPPPTFESGSQVSPATNLLRSLDDRTPPMRRPCFAAVVVILLGSPWTGLVHSQPPKDKYAEHIAPTGPRTPAEQQKLFRLPPGFEIQLVAAEP